MEGQALCAKVAAQDPKRADRMWNTVTDAQGHETIDPQARAKACEICSQCPVRLDCISRALVGGWKDDSIIGGIDYQRRKALSRVIAKDQGLDATVSVHRLAAWQVRSWLEQHPDWPTLMRREDTAYWRRTKRSKRAKRRHRPDIKPLFRHVAPMPTGETVQGILF